MTHLLSSDTGSSQQLGVDIERGGHWTHGAGQRRSQWSLLGIYAWHLLSPEVTCGHLWSHPAVTFHQCQDTGRGAMCNGLCNVCAMCVMLIMPSCAQHYLAHR